MRPGAKSDDSRSLISTRVCFYELRRRIADLFDNVCDAAQGELIDKTAYVDCTCLIKPIASINSAVLKRAKYYFYATCIAFNGHGAC